MRILLVPGYTGSGPEHWQTWLQDRYAGVDRVNQANWDWVDREAWIDAVDKHVNSTDDKLLLLGHSCGSITIAQWAASRPVPTHITGAVLVAPADVDADSLVAPIAAQRPLPTTVLPLPCSMIASTNDPFLNISRAKALASNWGCQELSWIQSGGHLASSDGYGPWPGIVRYLELRIGALALRKA